jgi:hypothetical protein
LSFQTPGSEDPDELMEALELFGEKVLPYIRYRALLIAAGYPVGNDCYGSKPTPSSRWPSDD